jgi:hypothetical protein
MNAKASIRNREKRGLDVSAPLLFASLTISALRTWFISGAVDPSLPHAKSSSTVPESESLEAAMGTPSNGQEANLFIDCLPTEQHVAGNQRSGSVRNLAALQDSNSA